MNAAIILAGGKGTRLGEGNPPKALLKLHDRNLLERQLDWLKGKVDVVVLALGHRAGEIVDYVKQKHLDVIISIEDSPLGSGGAVKKAFSHCSGAEKVYVLNVDDIAQVDIAKALKSETPCLVVHPVPFSVIAGDKLYVQNEAFQHIGHTIFSKQDIQKLPGVGSYEKWLQSQKVRHFVHAGIWATINSVAQLIEAERVWT